MTSEGRVQSMECGSCGQTFNVEDFFDHDCPGSSGRSSSRSTRRDMNGCGHVCCSDAADYEHAERPQDCRDCAEAWSDAQADAAMQAMDTG